MRITEQELVKLPVILVTPRQREVVDKAVEKGYYSSLSEFVRHCINKFEESHHLTSGDTFAPPAPEIQASSQ